MGGPARAAHFHCAARRPATNFTNVTSFALFRPRQRLRCHWLSRIRVNAVVPAPPRRRSACGHDHRILVDRLPDQHRRDRGADDRRPDHAELPWQHGQRVALMSSFIAHIQRLVADQRGSMLLEYTSVLLLFAIAAVAVLANDAGVIPK